ncbi:hypothetical protein [Burkholderia multivorans]|uniref:hypothetical protein n=1 Tax=Burkholderia multivorans TaxID=87883 RepID=UPI00373667DB
MLTNRDSGNSRSCRLASRDCLAPKERENRFDGIRRFKLSNETVIVKVARRRVLLDTVPLGTIGNDCSEHVGRTGEATRARRFSFADADADAGAADYRLGAPRAVLPHHALKVSFYGKSEPRVENRPTLART